MQERENGTADHVMVMDKGRGAWRTGPVHTYFLTCKGVPQINNVHGNGRKLDMAYIQVTWGCEEILHQPQKVVVTMNTAINRSSG